MKHSPVVKTHLHVSAWPESERPRERLLLQGPEFLSDAELVAVLLRSGTRGKDVVQLSRDLLYGFGGLRGLMSVEKSALSRVPGLGDAKISALIAVRELARRALKAEVTGKSYARDPQAVLAYLFASLRDRKKEVFKVLFLDKAQRILKEKDLFHGTVDETAVHIREVVREALENHATALILVHNHPSGRIEPSPEDREITRRISDACELVSVKVVDHIIVGDNRYFSFREEGLL